MPTADDQPHKLNRSSARLHMKLAGPEIDEWLRRVFFSGKRVPIILEKVIGFNGKPSDHQPESADDEPTQMKSAAPMRARLRAARAKERNRRSHRDQKQQEIIRRIALEANQFPERERNRIFCEHMQAADIPVRSSALREAGITDWRDAIPKYSSIIRSFRYYRARNS